MYQVKILPEAAAEAEGAADWYEAQQAGIGISFILELDAAVDRITTAPNNFEVLSQGVRRALMHRFPYVVYFLFGGNTLDVLAVLHQHQAPTTWQSRISSMPARPVG